MKRKTYLAIMALCLAMAAAGCGTAPKTADTNTSTDVQTDTEEEKTDEAKKEDEMQETKEPSGFGTRLVSVDKVEKYITLGNYKGLTLDNTVQEVTDDDVEAQIEADLTDKAEEVTEKDAIVQNGDIATINFVGTKDGKAFDGGTANNYDLTVGSGGMIDGFEDGIVGMKKGETKDLNLTFPEDYMEASLAGEDVVFQITVQNFRRVQELSDEWVAKNTEFTTVDEYREGVRADLEKNAQKMAEENLRSSAWNTVYSESEVKEYPQEDIDNADAEFMQIMEQYAEQSGMKVEEMVEAQGISMDDFEEQRLQYAQMKVKQNLIVQGIMDAEGMTLEDEESLKIQDQMIQEYKVADLAALIDQYGQTSVDETIGLIRVEDFIVAHAEISEQVTDGEIVGVDGDKAPSGDEDGLIVENEEEIEAVQDEEDLTEDLGAEDSDADQSADDSAGNAEE